MKMTEMFSSKKEEEQGQENTTQDAFKNLDVLNKLDQNFNELFDKVTVNNHEGGQLFSSTMQKIDLSNMAKNISMKVKQNQISGSNSNFKNASEEDQEYIDKLLNSESNDILKIFNDSNIQNNRKAMYEMYDEVANINQIAYRMLQVYINNILIKNNHTKQFINIVPNENNPVINKINEKEKEKIKDFIKTILIYFDIQSRLKNRILPDTLKYGDCYLEIVNLENIDTVVSNNRHIIEETIVYEDKKTRQNISQKVKLAIFEDYSLDTDKEVIRHLEESDITPKVDFNDQLKNLIRNKQMIEEFDMSYFSDIIDHSTDEFDIKDFQTLNLENLNNIYLKLIPAGNVLKIEKDGNLYGYLIIEDISKEEGADHEIDLYQRFLNDDNKEKYKSKNIKKQEEKMARLLVNSLGSKLMEILNRDPNYISDLPEDLLQSLKIISYEKIKKKAKLKFRFLQTDNLINFHINIDKYAPYGTSIFDPIIVPVKMYTIALMSSIISRLSRAAVVRKWNIEVGTQRNYPEMIEKVKKDLKTKSISYQSLSSIKNISQVLTDFRDIAVISQNGKRFIDMEIMPMQDRALPLNDLNDLRNELIASTGIPSVYLNIGDAIELRETLVNINISFSQTVITYQSFLEDGLNKLINIIFKVILKNNDYNESEFKLSNFFKITLNAPLVLQLQNSEAVINTIANIIGLLNQSQLKIDPKELFKMYAPNIPWDSLVESGERLIAEEKKDALMKGDGQQGGGF